MAADQVQEKPAENKPDAKASDSKAAEPPKSEADKATDKMQEEVNPSLASAKTGSDQSNNDVAKTPTDASDSVTAEDAESTSPWQKELQNERDELRKKYEKGELDENGRERFNQLDQGFKSIAEARKNGVSEEQIRAKFGNLVIEDKSTKSIELDGTSSGRKTSDSGNFSLTMDGKELVNFNDASWGLSKDSSVNADISVHLPESATSVENVHGKMSVVPGADGTNARIIESADGRVMVNRGGEYVVMDKGMTGGFGQKVIEGEEAKKLFESEEKKFESVDVANSNGKISISSGNGVNLVDITMGNVSVNTPDGAQVTAQNDAGKYMRLDNGTQMITGDDGTMIRQANGDVISVGKDGQVTEMAGTEAATSETWNDQFKKFETDVKVAGSDDSITAKDNWFSWTDVGKSLVTPSFMHDFSFDTTNFGFSDFKLWGSDSLDQANPIGEPSKDIAAADKSLFSYASDGWDWLYGKGEDFVSGVSDMFTFSDSGDSATIFKQHDSDIALGLDGSDKTLFDKTGKTPEEWSKLVNSDFVDKNGENVLDRTQGNSSVEIDGKKYEITSENGEKFIRTEDGTRIMKGDGAVIVQTPPTADNPTGEIFKIFDGSDGSPERTVQVTDTGQIQTIKGKFDGFDSMTTSMSSESFDWSKATSDHAAHENQVKTWGDGSMSFQAKNGDIVRVMKDGAVERRLEDGTILRRENGPQWSSRFGAMVGGRGNGGDWQMKAPGETEFKDISREEAFKHLPKDPEDFMKLKSLRALQLRAAESQFMGPPLPPSMQGDATPASDEPVKIGNFDVDVDPLTGGFRARQQGQRRDGKPIDVAVATTATGATVDNGVTTSAQNFENKTVVETNNTTGQTVATWDYGNHTYEDALTKIDPTGTQFKPLGMLIDYDNNIFHDDNGDGIFDPNEMLYDYDNGSWANEGSTWGTSAYDGYGSYNSPEQVALEAKAESEAAAASGIAAEVAAIVAGAVASGNVSLVLGSMARVAAAYGAIANAQASAMSAGDSSLVGMLSLQTSQVNNAAGNIILTAGRVNENNRVGGPLEGDSTLAKSLTMSVSISNPLLDRARILKNSMGRGDDPLVKQYFGSETETA